MPTPIMAAALAVMAGTGVYESSESGKAAKAQKNATQDALDKQEAEKQRLLAEAGAAPEQEREAELEKRRRRVQTLLTDQEDTGMATVGKKVLLGG